MKTRIVSLVALTAVLALPYTAHAGSKPKAHSLPAGHASAKAASAATFECSICHHKATAAQAKALHYTCPVDNGRLVLIKSTSLHKPR